MNTATLLRALADGEPHSGEELAKQFEVTRAAVWKHVMKLERWGLAVRAVPGVGYRLARAIEPLDAPRLRRALCRSHTPCAAPGARAEPHADARTSGGEWRLGTLEVFDELPSTNRYLLERAAPPAGSLAVCLAEFQTAGRGRRGRRWHTPYGAGICLSAAWQFAETPPELQALTLAVGVVARRAIAAACGVEVALKWPNDLVWDGRKLGGILLEIRLEQHGGCHVVAGVGVNVDLPDELKPNLSDWPGGAADLAEAETRGSGANSHGGGAASRATPSRHALVVTLVEGLGTLFGSYASTGFGAYRLDFDSADWLKGRRVALDDAHGQVCGTALGIEADGALVIETAPGARRRVLSGDVSVRDAR